VSALSPTVLALPAAVVGFALGWLSARLTELVTPPEEAPKIHARSALVRDPLVQGVLAVLWAAIPFLISGDLLRWLEAAVISVPLVQVAVTDLRTRYVYTVIAAIGLILGVALGWQFHTVPWFWSVIGAAVGAVVFSGLYWIGRLIYRGGEPMARGDITIAAMVGAGAAMCVAQALVWGVLASGLLAIVFLVLTRSRQAFMPYGPGLCLGGLATLFLC
jgi:prepilin signal peptidase PulO-like enzyme (type II secretory pathway)